MVIEYFLIRPIFKILIGLLVIWEIIWKGIALWKASKNGHRTWFWFILVLNTAGILPIVYLLFFSKKSKRASKRQKSGRK